MFLNIVERLLHTVTCLAEWFLNEEEYTFKEEEEDEKITLICKDKEFIVNESLTDEEIVEVVDKFVKARTKNHVQTD